MDALPPDFRRRVGDHEPACLADAVRKAVVLETQDTLYPVDPVIVAAAAPPPEWQSKLEALEQTCAAQTKLLEKLASRLDDSGRPSGRPRRVRS